MKILAYTSPARGHLFPLVPVLDELGRRGHDVAVRTLASQTAALEACGFSAQAIAPAIEAIEHDDFRARTPPAKVGRAMATFGARAEHDAADLEAAITAERPDAVLVDVMSWGASAVAERSGLPWAQWLPYPLPVPSPDGGVPPFGPGLTPAHGPLGRLRDRALGPLLERVAGRAALPLANAVRGRAGVPPYARVADIYTSAPLLLYMTAEPLEYPRPEWPAGVRMVGPCAWEPPADPPPWLEAVDRPLVLVSTSSEFQDDGRLVATTLEALAGEDVHLVATVPAAGLAGLTVPANARVAEFLPHTPLLAKAACVVTHGGAGATQKALAAGVPVCVVPFGRDQFEVARRVEVAGAGTRLPAPRLSPARLRAAVLEAMTKTDGARRVADGFAATGGPVAAADAVEGLAGARAPA
ncbi:hypothetical protein NBH00_06675 [Paraconexibacter antarcticus]|uniref:Erythromycin biosynthesis protein CIII-like C-terminal domain-containing protein n=1 Tax=Paraconexibacter antarcticus TaxID=2949664 RepID=A0ABY5DW53_9ACTN|nr:nucleotide disphospho-sugar-binding domain-containing protein [Paraconexibacter antarcticus]UTI65891.1 hypothetical protein NBH00_06675 [Paraconexibacter antarcticus]